MSGGAELEYTPEMKNRLKRIEGQIRGILRMLEEEKDCKEVITQLSASRTAIDRTIGLIVGTNLEQCLREQMEQGESMNGDLVKEAVQLLVRSR
jgi:DNA-binding FrmR family transcriptional regulator